jgi:type IX secretion system substrate protein/fibronectin type III domain protein
MKIITLILVAFSVILQVSAQSAGDYRSNGTGNWNDHSKWEIFNGSNWVNAGTYPGENSNAGTVTISNATQIMITASVAYPISSLLINTDFDQIQSPGKLVFTSSSAVSLTVAGNVIVYGSMWLADQSGSKSHSLIIGGGLVLGTWTYVFDTTCVDFYSCPVYYNYFFPDISTINNDDKLAITFNTTVPGSSISGIGSIIFQDVTFNGLGISIGAPIYINGNANFVNGVVKAGNFCSLGCIMDGSGFGCPPSNCGVVFFNDGSTCSGASANSFVDGRVWKRGDDPFTFPIGTEGLYSPLTISAPVGAGEILSARYVRSGQDPSLWGITDPALYSLSSCEHWELNPGDIMLDYNNNYNAQTSYPLNVTVGWSPSNNCGSSYITNVPSVTLAHFNGTSWDTHGGSPTGTTSSGTLTRSVDYFGSFTLGNINSNCVTVAALSATNITSSSASLNWSPVPGAISYDVAYKPTTTNTWTYAGSGITTTSLNLPGLNPLVTFDWKVRANCGSSSSSAYRLGSQFTTQNPCGTPSGLMSTNITSTSALLSWNAVPNASYTVRYKVTGTTSWIDAAINIGSTSINLNGLSTATMYDWSVSTLCYYSSTYTYYGGGIAQSSFTTTACSDLFEPNNISSQAKTINLETIVSATISSATDADWFKVTMSNNSSLALQATLSNLPADYDLFLYNKNLSLVGASANTGTLNDVVLYDSRQRNATYYIKVVGKNGASNAIQCYNLLAQAVPGAITTSTLNAGNETISTSRNVLFYPNPASDIVNVQLNSMTKEPSDVQILNNVGQVVKSYHLNIVKGNNLIKIPLHDITPGVYILKIGNSDFSTANKFVIAR